VGSRTAKKLCARGIRTIGEIANADPEMMRHMLGKNGLMLMRFALGLDMSPVMPSSYESAVKSVGNSATLPHDIESLADAESVFYLLAESVGARLREQGFRSRCVNISVRTTDLIHYGCQLTLKSPTMITREIAQTALCLFKERYMDLIPLRSVGISCTNLVPDTAPEQIGFLDDEEKRRKCETLEHSLDDLRKRYGHQVVQRGVVLADRRYAQINPKEEHVIHPVAFLKGVV